MTTINQLAKRIAKDHAESPEVRAAGGPSADDSREFHQSDLARALREVGLPDDKDSIDTLREKLSYRLADLV